MFLVSRVLMIFQACGAKRPVEVIAANAPIIKVEVSSARRGSLLLRAARLIGATPVSVTVRFQTRDQTRQKKAIALSGRKQFDDQY
jgi:hypothetical protein